jgi:hypothetical protein
MTVPRLERHFWSAIIAAGSSWRENVPVGWLSYLRSRLTYANVVATLALFVALGGASYAAVALAPDSVGTAQLKNNAVISTKVKDGSLLARDFGAGQLPAGPRGPRGFMGLRGPAGRDGASVAVRPRSTGSVDTPADHSDVAIPLTSSSWTQAASEVDFGPFGVITYTSPDSASCGGTGLAYLNVSINIDGKPFAFTAIETARDGAMHAHVVDATHYLFEPGSAVAHTATASVSSGCVAGSFPAPFSVNSLSFDIVRAS